MRCWIFKEESFQLSLITFGQEVLDAFSELFFKRKQKVGHFVLLLVNLDALLYVCKGSRNEATYKVSLIFLLLVLLQIVYTLLYRLATAS
mgnify:CR=1 FL=1